MWREARANGFGLSELRVLLCHRCILALLGTPVIWSLKWAHFHSKGEVLFFLCQVTRNRNNRYWELGAETQSFARAAGALNPESLFYFRSSSPHSLLFCAYWEWSHRVQWALRPHCMWSCRPALISLCSVLPAHSVTAASPGQDHRASLDPLGSPKYHS